MTVDSSSSLREVAFEVCAALHSVGVTVVLTGGSAATFYAPEAYQSKDLDFVVFAGRTDDRAEQALLDLGYQREGNHYSHASSPFLLEFPAGPLAVGGERIERYATYDEDGRVANVIAPTDACKDRLAAFFHWNDRSALEQALAVGRAHREHIDVAGIKAWAADEGHEEKFEEFERDFA